MENTPKRVQRVRKQEDRMSHSSRKPKEITREEYERIRDRHWRRIEPYFIKLEAQRILDEMDRQREAPKNPKRTGEDG